jgi:hypothetical protein
MTAMTVSGIDGAPTANVELLSWVREVADLTMPDRVVWCDGSDEEWDRMTTQLVEAGTFVKLNESKKPNSFWAASDPDDVARVEERTYICTEEEVGAGLHTLTGSQELWERYARAGYGRVLARYTWERTAEGYLQAISGSRNDVGRGREEGATTLHAGDDLGVGVQRRRVVLGPMPTGLNGIQAPIVMGPPSSPEPPLPVEPPHALTASASTASRGTRRRRGRRTMSAPWSFIRGSS